MHSGAVHSPPDLEKGPFKSPAYGFASVADLIARDPDKSGTIYRRFDKLAARNLLYLESKLAVLEQKQEEFDEEDANGESFELRSAATSWEDFVQYAQDSNRPEHQTRMQLVTDIEETLQTYCMCLH